MRTRSKHAMMSVVPALLAGAWLYAGPLNPPAGPIVSTGKALTEVEPRIAINATNTPGDNDSSPSLYKITQPGSYYLTGNVTGVVGKHGIEITSSGVTIDLGGFDLSGIPAMGAFDGVRCTVTGLSNVVVRNGYVRGWGGHGIELGALALRRSTIDGIHASSNASLGIRVGPNATVSGCTASLNGSNGITTDTGSIITHCVVDTNGVSGISAGNANTISACTASSNTGVGIFVGIGGTVTGCAANNNGADGINTSAGSTIAHCTVYANADDGVVAGLGGTIVDCTAYTNTGDGIQVAGSCTVRNNTCKDNGLSTGDGAGVHATGADNRIEGNLCNTADRGIDVDAAGNIILRNTCSGNTTNWDIVANNVYGPILDRTSPGSIPVLGNAAASSLGTTDANANFTY